MLYKHTYEHVCFANIDRRDRESIYELEKAAIDDAYYDLRSLKAVDGEEQKQAG